mgnify:CR=1 FL=1
MFLVRKYTGSKKEKGAKIRMRKIEVKVCKACGKTYLHKSGGIIGQPIDLINGEMCPACRIKTVGKGVKRIMDIIKGEGGHG